MSQQDASALSPRSVEIITSSLGVENIADVVHRDFTPADSTEFDEREAFARFGHLVRGSVRLAQGRFRTAREFAEFRRRALSAPLP